MPLQSNATRSKFGLASAGGGLFLFVACGGIATETDESRHSSSLLARATGEANASLAGTNPGTSGGFTSSASGGFAAFGGSISAGGSVAAGGATASGGIPSEGGSDPGDGLAGSLGAGGSGEEDPVETKAIDAILKCLNDKQAKQKAPLSVADAIDCFPKECTYELVMSVKSLHNSCYTPNGCELPRVLLHCGEGTGSSIGSFNLCPTRSDRVKGFTHHFEVSEEVGTTDDKTRIFAFSQGHFPWKQQDILITPDKKFTCFGGTCHAFAEKPSIANKGVPYLDQIPKHFPEKQKDLEAVCKCMTDEAFTEVKYSKNSDGIAVEKDDIALVRKMCDLLKERFKQRPQREAKQDNEEEEKLELEAVTDFVNRIQVDSAPIDSAP